jgi:hypothetical protein
VKKISASLGFSSVVSDPGFLGLSDDSEPDSVPAQLETSLVAFLSVSKDSAIRQLESSQRFSFPPAVTRGVVFDASGTSTWSEVSNDVGSLSLGTSSSVPACSVL